jgi:hypothetical protein
VLFVQLRSRPQPTVAPLPHRSGPRVKHGACTRRSCSPRTTPRRRALTNSTSPARAPVAGRRPPGRWRPSAAEPWPRGDRAADRGGCADLTLFRDRRHVPHQKRWVRPEDQGRSRIGVGSGKQADRAPGKLEDCSPAPPCGWSCVSPTRGPGSSPWSSGCTLAIKNAVREHKRPRLDRYQDHTFLTWPSQSVPATCGEGGIGPSRAPPARATAAAYDVNGSCGAQGAGLP